MVELLKDYKIGLDIPDYDYCVEECIDLHNGTNISLHTFSNYTGRGCHGVPQLPLTQYLSEESYRELLTLLEELEPTYQVRSQGVRSLDKYIEDTNLLNGLEYDDCKVKFDWEYIF